MHGTRPHKGLSKRVRISRNGQVKHKKSGGGHRKAKHTSNQNMKLRNPKIAPEVERRRCQQMLGFRIRRVNKEIAAASAATSESSE